MLDSDLSSAHKELYKVNTCGCFSNVLVKEKTNQQTKISAHVMFALNLLERPFITFYLEDQKEQHNICLYAIILQIKL